MNAKILFKTVFLIIIALMLVIMGMNNKDQVSLKMPPVMPKTLTQPAAIMYIGFFGVGLLCGAVLIAGGKKGGSSGSSSSKGKEK